MMRRPSFRDSWVVRLRRHLRNQRVFRPRPRRLASAFLKLRREAGRPAEVFDAAELERRLRSGLPDDAYDYLERFFTYCGSHPRPTHSCQILLGHVAFFKIHARIAAGGEEADSMASRHIKARASYPKHPTIDYFFNTIAEMHADRTRASIIWQELKPVAVDRIMDMVAKCPDLQGQVRVPREEPRLLGAAPFCLPESPSRFPRTTTRAPAHLLARTFLYKRLLLVQGTKHSSDLRNASSRSATANMKMGQTDPQPTVLEGVSHAPAVHHKPCTMTSPSENSAFFSSASNAAVDRQQGDDCTVLEKGMTSLNFI